MTTTLHELPPLHVTTVGIPPDEHITERESHHREHELWWGSDMIAWLALWLLVLILGFFVTALLAAGSVGSAPGGIAWSDQRAGERATTTASTTYAPNLASPFTGEPYVGYPTF
jgi:hypothetical protein